MSKNILSFKEFCDSVNVTPDKNNSLCLNMYESYIKQKLPYINPDAYVKLVTRPANKSRNAIIDFIESTIYEAPADEIDDIAYNFVELFNFENYSRLNVGSKLDAVTTVDHRKRY